MLMIRKQRFSSLSIVAGVIAVIGLALSIATFFAPFSNAKPFFEKPYNIYRTIIMLVSMVSLAVATRNFWLYRQDKDDTPTSPKIQTCFNRLAIIIPAIALIFLAIQLAFPEFATLLVRKEDWPFFRNAIFVKFALLLVATIFFIRTAVFYGRKKQYLAMTVAVLFLLLLFVMTGEELSWGQRIFQWTTPDSVATGNQQGETNLHNFATQTFQNCLYFGTWLLLILIPFLRKWLITIISKIKALRFLEKWIPATEFIMIFAVSYGFVDSLNSETGIYYGSNLFTIIGTFCILIAMIIRGTYNDDKSADKYLAVLGAFLAILMGNLFFSKVWDSNPGAPTEYLEMFIDCGIMVWAIYVHDRATISNNSRLAKQLN